MPAVHPNYVKASYLILLQLTLALANYFFNYNDIPGVHMIIIPVVVTIVSGILFYLIRIGTNWIKYVLLVFWVGANIKPSNWTAMFTHGIERAIIGVVGFALGGWVLWLLFKIPNEDSANKKGLPV